MCFNPYIRGSSQRSTFKNPLRIPKFLSKKRDCWSFRSFHHTNNPHQNIKLKPPLIVFLDVDGVIYNASNQNGVFEKAAELFPTLTKYDNRVCSIAASYFFDKKALTNLDYSIKQFEKIRNVSIVISSDWREGTTVDDLKKIFGIHNFSKYIIDKTPEGKAYDELKDCCIRKDIHYSACRASEIKWWLNQHPEVSDFLILDDRDSHLSDNFGEKFIKTNYRQLIDEKITAEMLKIINISRALD